MLSIRGAYAVHSLTAGDGPWLVGVMNSDLSLAELEAYLELGGPLSPAKQAESEITSRGKVIRQLGLLVPAGNGTVAGMPLADQSLKGLRFSEADETTTGWSHWLYNISAAMTTGATWQQVTSAFVRWNPSG